MSISNQVNNIIEDQEFLIETLGNHNQDKNNNNEGPVAIAINVINEIPQPANQPVNIVNIEQRLPQRIEIIVADLIDDRVSVIAERRPSVVNEVVEIEGPGIVANLDLNHIEDNNEIGGQRISKILRRTAGLCVLIFIGAITNSIINY